MTNRRAQNPRTAESRALGRRIREERIRAGLSRHEFAMLLQTSPKAITNYEIGFAPSPVRLAKIGRALGRSVEYLRTGTGTPYAPEALGPGQLTPDESFGLSGAMIRLMLDTLARRISALEKGFNDLQENVNRALAASQHQSRRRARTPR